MRSSAPTIVITSVEFWTIEVSRRWTISDVLSAALTAWTRNGASPVPMARERSSTKASWSRSACAPSSNAIQVA
jgi:hypothetical protein